MTQNSTTIRGGFDSRRDHTAPRRAYLDTYAQKRGGGVSAPATPTQSAAQSAPVELPQAVSPTPHLVKQALQTEFVQQPQQVAAAQLQKSSLGAPFDDVSAPSHQQYLDTLTRRHHRAVQSAQHAEETVLQPSLSDETAALLEQPQVDEARIEANLKALYSNSLTEMMSRSNASASASHIRTIVASALACGILSVGIFSFFSQYNAPPVVAQPIGTPVIEVESSNSQQPQGTDKSTVSGPVVTDPSHPIRLVASSIGVNAPVEGLGTTPDGLIAVPKSYGVVGWYNKGSVPGKSGPAVLVGHYTGGQKGVFDNLKDLKQGDLVTTTNGKGESFTYRVTALNEYDRDKVPMADLFKSSDSSRLEIITCSGKWQANNYTKRFVVTAELVR